MKGKCSYNNDKDMEMTVLCVRNLTKTFTSSWSPFSTSRTYTAVDNISFELRRGEILGFLGANGAGKTTTIQMLLGTLTPTSGSLHYFGQDFTQHSLTVLKRIGYASGYDRLPRRLSVMENLDIIGRIYGLSDRARKQQIETLLSFFGIWQLRHQQTATLSAGQITRVMLAKAFLAHPEIILLDEPTASLDPDVAYETRQFIKEQRAQRNISLLITSHNMYEVTDLCDRVLVLKEGRIIADNTPAMLAQSITKVKMQLTITHNMDYVLSHLRQLSLLYTQESEQITIELHEQEIASFLSALAQHQVVYSSIAINKPTLEDYFLSVVS
jgi:ABC-2 type transport system ATP-binding protein